MGNTLDNNLINRQAVLDMVHKSIYEFFDICGNNEEVSMSDKDKMLLEVNKAICNKLKQLPSVMPKEETGRWINFGIQGEIDGQIVRAFTCSKCGAISIFRVSNENIVNGDLCPNCGCHMVKPQESEGVRNDK